MVSGKADAGVAGGGLDDHGFLCEEPFCFRVVDHGTGHAVLGGTGGIEILQFGQNPGPETFGLLQMGQFQKRGFADQLINRCKDCRHVDFLLQNKKPEGPSGLPAELTLQSPGTLKRA